MSSVFEKITLYDFFGYLIPGITFETLVYIAAYFRIIVESYDFIFDALSDVKGYLYVIYFLLGYVLGVFLSEIARWIYTRIEKLLHGFYYTSVVSKLKIEKNTIWKALVCSGLVDEQCQPPNDLETLLKSYLQIMLGNIQTDEKYKRIHDYSSFATMCKNLSIALIAAGTISGWLVWPMYGGLGVMVIACISIFAAVIFGIRYERFNVKKAIYTVIWFVSKSIADQKKLASAETQTQ